MKANYESQLEISYINNRPIPEGQISDNALVFWGFLFFLFTGSLFAILGGDR
jgi:hypothetical protein